MIIQKDLRVLLRLEVRVIVGLLVAYLAFVLLGTDYLANARVFARCYRAYNLRGASIYGSSFPEYWNAVAIGALIPIAARWEPVRALFVLANLAFLLSGVLQRKGWLYHWVPFWMRTALGTSVLLNGLRWSALARWVPLGLLALSLLVMGISVRAMSFEEFSGYGQTISTTTHLFSAYARGGGVLAITTSADPVFPSLRMAGGHVVNRANCMAIPGVYEDAWDQPGPFPYHSPEKLDPIERDFVRNLVRDLRRAHPPLVVVGTASPMQGFGSTNFDWIEYLDRDTDWRTEFHRAYREVEGASGIRMFLRRDLPDPIRRSPPGGTPR